MRSVKDVDGKENKTRKRLKMLLKTQNLKNILMFCLIKKSWERTQNKLHRIGTNDVCKIYLSCFDDKRYILDDGINTLA